MERKGGLLEDNLAIIFEKAGFKVQQRYKINDYEIDVIAKKFGLTIICECKQYEQAPLIVRNIIHQWDSKNKEINADKVVLAVYGVYPSKEDKALANKYNLILWDEKDIIEYMKLDSKELSQKLLFDLKLKKRTIKEWLIWLLKKRTTIPVLIVSFLLSINIFVFYIKGLLLILMWYGPIIILFLIMFVAFFIIILKKFRS